MDLDFAARQWASKSQAALEAGEHFAAGDAGHQRIERNAFGALGLSTTQVDAIYFGNWQRDLSQVLAPMLTVLGARAGFACDVIFRVVDVLAEAEFRRRLDRSRLGTYRWEEHIDNPRLYG